MNKQTAGLKQQSGGNVSRRNSSASLLMSAASGAAGGGHDGEGAGLVSRSGFPISRQASSSALSTGGVIHRQPSVLGGSRARRPSLLGVSALHMPSLHALPENDAYLGPPKPRSPRKTSSFLTGPPSGSFVTRDVSSEQETIFDPTMPLLPQSDVLDASLMEPEIVEHNMNLPLEISRCSTSGSLEAASGFLQGAAPLAQVRLHAHLPATGLLFVLHLEPPLGGGNVLCTLHLRCPLQASMFGAVFHIVWCMSVCANTFLFCG